MKNLRFTATAALATAALTTLAACGSGGGSASVGEDESSPAASGKAEQGAVNLGAVLPVTGASATIGEDQRRGVELAVEQINADGGVLGKDLNVVVEDSQGVAASSLDAARKLVSVDNAPVVIGEYSSGNTIPLGQFLQREGVVHINPGSSSPEIADIGDMSFSTIGLDTIAGKFTADAVFDRGYEKAAFLVPNNSYGEGVLETFKERYEEIGGEITSEILYTEGQTDYRSELQRLAEGEPDVFVYSAYGQESSVINKQAFEMGLNDKPWFGIYLSMTTADSDQATVEGQIGMDLNYIGPDGQTYEAAYKEKYGEDFASTFSGYTYDAVMLAAEAIEKAGSAEPDAVAKAMAEVGKDFSGATGEISLDEDGQRTDQPYAVLEYQEGDLVPAS